MITAGNLRMTAVMYARAVAAVNNPNFDNAFEKAEAEKAADKAGERLEEAARQFVAQETARGQVEAESSLPPVSIRAAKFWREEFERQASQWKTLYDQRDGTLEFEERVNRRFDQMAMSAENYTRELMAEEAADDAS